MTGCEQDMRRLSRLYISILLPPARLLNLSFLSDMFGTSLPRLHTSQACGYVMPYRTTTPRPQQTRPAREDRCMSWNSCPFARSADGDESHKDGGSTRQREQMVLLLAACEEGPWRGGVLPEPSCGSTLQLEDGEVRL